jgi:hypothetical protein
MDAEAGGEAELQTDVMRFMAILSLCLVAIFALVQSVPLPPPAAPSPSAAETTPATVTAAREPAPMAEPEPAPQQPLQLVRPAAQKLPDGELEPALERPRPAAKTSESKAKPATPPVTQQEASPAPPVTAKQGFTLRFDNDVALTRLVARHEVSLYAMLPDQSLRMNVNRGELSFWPASLPGEFHEMDASTVPDSVLAAFARRNEARAASTQWGVTIPPEMRRQLDGYLRDASGGTLIIDADGKLRLEP